MIGEPLTHSQTAYFLEASMEAFINASISPRQTLREY